MKRTVRYGLAISEEKLGDGAPVPLQGGLEAAMVRAAQLGYDAVELHIRNPGDFSADSLYEAARRAGVTVAAIGTGLEYSLNGLSLTADDDGIRKAMAQRLREHIDLAARFGAVVFIGLCRGKAASYGDRAAALRLLARELAPIAQYAHARHVPLSFEPIAFYLTNLLNTTGETLEFLQQPGLETVSLLLDTHHMFLEDPDMEEAIARCAGRIAYVHISDSNRQSPGWGNVDFARVGAALGQAGYEGVVSLEALPFPTPEQAAARGLAWMRETWGP